MNVTYLPQIDLQWKNIDTIFLDMDGTLLDLHYDTYFWLQHLPRRLAEIRQWSVEQAEAFLNTRHAQTRGTLDWYCVDTWDEFLGFELFPLKQEVAHKVAYREHVPEFLEFLRAMNKRVVLLTNAHEKSLRVKTERLTILPYFDRVILSHDLRMAKEHADFWAGVQAIEDFDRERSLFIDDNLAVLTAAKDYGVKHLLAVRQPDLSQGEQDVGDYVGLRSYRQLMQE